QRFRQPRLEPGCGKTWRTVSYDTDSTTCSATSPSASSRSVQRLWPSGGALQVSATSRASCSPSNRRWYWRAGGWRSTAASSPAATYFMRTRAAVGGCTPSAAPWAASAPPGAGLALVGLEQDARMGQRASRADAPPDHGVQPGALLLR